MIKSEVCFHLSILSRIIRDSSGYIFTNFLSFMTEAISSLIYLCALVAFIVNTNGTDQTALRNSQSISEPIFYGDVVYKFKRIVGKPNFSDQFKKIVKRYIRVGYNLDIMRQSACLVLNPITVYSYGFLFNCTTVGQEASDSMTALT